MRRRLSILILSLAGLVATPVSTQGPCASVDLYRYSHFSPAVIYADGVDSTTLEVGTAASGVSAVYLDWDWERLRMYDDGTHGDRAARDSVYTLSGIAYLAPPDFRYDFEGKHTLSGGSVFIVKTDGTEERWGITSLGMVAPGQRMPWVDLGRGLSATRSAFFVVDNAGEIFPNMPLTSIPRSKLFTAATRKLYSALGDAFDFVVLMPNGALYDPVDYGERSPYCSMTRNDVQHIGVPIFNESANWGSHGRLRGVVYHSFGSLSILDHEICHSWGMRIGYGLGLTTGNASPDRYGHWNALADINGQLSSFVFAGDVVGCLADNGDGTWRIQPTSRDGQPFAPLELYIMGLLPPEHVPPVHILVNPNYSNPQRVTAARVTTVTMQQIMAGEGGARVPAWPQAQDYFTAALMAVSNHPFTAAERAFYTLEAEFYASNLPGQQYSTPFYAGSGGRGRINFLLPVPGLRDVYLPAMRAGFQFRGATACEVQVVRDS